MNKKYKILLVICLTPIILYLLYKSGEWLYYRASFYYAKSQEKVLAEFPLGCKYDGYDLCNPVFSFKGFSKEDKEQIMKQGLLEYTKRLLFSKSNIDNCYGFWSYFNKKVRSIAFYQDEWEHPVYSIGTTEIKFDDYDKPFFYFNDKATLDIKKNDKNELKLTFNYPGLFDFNSNESFLIKKEYNCTELIVKADDYLVYKCRFDNKKDKYVKIEWWGYDEKDQGLSVKHSDKLSCLSKEYNYSLYKDDKEFYDKYFNDYKRCYEKYPMYQKK
ncbi:MAG: hypothetical protein BWY78_00238 [Alphaproteobacteria bacterium ADurb.Bin438]|nr:MAG: hypothetical protein BWY78_00238 [Alphaproteobacteria bacterium ADurb.Bin438]